MLKGHPNEENLNLLAIPHYYDGQGQLVLGVRGKVPNRIDFRPKLDYSSMSPVERLTTAAYYGVYEEVRAAIRAGADINALDREGSTALMKAIVEQDARIVRWLLEHGASPDTKNRDRMLPVCIAAFSRNVEIIRLLGLFDADWSAFSHDRAYCDQPVLIAAITQTGNENQALELVELLLDAGASHEVRYHGKTASTFTQEAGFSRVERALLARHPNSPSLPH